MKPFRLLSKLHLAGAFLVFAQNVLAGPGHDHGESTPSNSGQALPRFAAASETFELVGVIDGKKVTLYLDQFTSNAPIKDAKIELEIAGNKLTAQARDDVYEINLKEELKPGVLPITATVTASTEIDLLAGELDLHHTVEPTESSSHLHSSKEFATWVAGALLGFLLLIFIGRRLSTSRRYRKGGLA